ncbi:MAG: chemotaxis protein CheA [Gammaproteobacteria bacterium]|nr:chemotaxis protein CheA [Gammaproteobacteria bacterium]
MPVDLNDEIVQDFLVEAGEILEQLGEQLIDLEMRPEDAELLNAVFRGFHTIKGGAGFIALDPLVQICHRAEDVFNLLRQGDRQVDAHLMDVVLKALDSVNVMFSEIGVGDDPTPAPQEVIEALNRILSGEQGPVETVMEKTLDVPPPAPAVEQSSFAESDEITDDEFEALLDALEDQEQQPTAPGPKTPVEPPGAKAAAGSDEITDDEFESLLDQLHGKGKHQDGPKVESAGTQTPTVAPVAATKATVPKTPPAPPAAQVKPGVVKGAGEGPAKVAKAEPTVRVDTGVLDHIMNMVGELVLVRNRLAALESESSDEELAKAVANLDVVTADLQAGVMRTRMQPIKKVFGRFPRVIRDLARNLKKDVLLELKGEDTDLDKNLVEALADPMIHLVRNAVDHGVETPEIRESMGKPRQGTVSLSAAQEGDHILLTIVDDGAGMDADVLRKIAVDKGLMDEDAAARLDDKECYNLIFAPGFSSKKEISDVSGRGVGMDVVKTRISQLNGSVEIDSAIGTGSTIKIKLPLTLAIVPTLMVALGNQIFAFPLMNVNEIFDLRMDMTNIVDGQLVARVRDKPLPLFYLGQWLTNISFSRENSGGHVVVVHVGTQQIGFVVDQLLGQEEVVIKPLGALLQGIKGLAGATITGDGRIALILDVPSLIKAYAHRY